MFSLTQRWYLLAPSSCGRRLEGLLSPSLILVLLTLFGKMEFYNLIIPKGSNNSTSQWELDSSANARETHLAIVCRGGEQGHIT